MRIIPAIDIIDGKCVRLTKGDYNLKKVYNEHPLEVAKEFEDNGIQFLHLVDLDGAKAKHLVNWKVLERISNQTNLKIDFGGGIQSEEDIKIAFESGAQQITGGSIAVKKEALFLDWLENFGPKKIILGADAKDKKIAIHGWEDTTDLALSDFIKKYTEKGIQYTICTDISKDGLLQGSAIETYQELMEQFPDLKLIASGGITDVSELEKLAGINVEGAIIGKAIYEERITFKDLQKYL